MSESLQLLGWNEFFARQLKEHTYPDAVPARVIVQQKTYFIVMTAVGEFTAKVTGRLRFLSGHQADLPVVGDWVVLRPTGGERTGSILAVLQRKTAFSRRAPGREEAEQVVAANIDIVFLVTGLDGNYNLRRIERYLSLAHRSGAQPILVLNKADLCSFVDDAVEDVQAICAGAPLYVTNAKSSSSVDCLRAHLSPGVTAAFLGSSGVGKSTLINSLLGREKFKTAEVREDDSRGRHTTTHRELVALPSGANLIDTPGMRELQLWEVEEGIDEAFDDIEELAKHCKFRDCRHGQEPGCAVRKAVDDGNLDPARLESHRKLLREMEYQRGRGDVRTRQEQKAKDKKMGRIIREYNRTYKRKP
jgi:ribosome biogenesis GTPase